MDQLTYTSLSHTHCWYKVGMLKVPASCRLLFLTFSVLAANPSKLLLLYTVANPGRGLLNRNMYDVFIMYSNHLALF